MKADSPQIQTTRFYEIVEVPKGTVWHDEPGSMYCTLGAIVRPTALDPGRFTIIKSSSTGYLSVSKSDDIGVFMGDDIILRPLNKKDQAKLQQVRDQFV